MVEFAMRLKFHDDCLYDNGCYDISKYTTVYWANGNYVMNPTPYVKTE